MSDLRKIVRNTEGIWAGSNNATTKRPTIWLDGVDGTEATSGNCDIWAPRMYCAVMRSTPADAPGHGAQRIRAWRYGRWKKRRAAHTATGWVASRLRNHTPGLRPSVT